MACEASAGDQDRYLLGVVVAAALTGMAIWFLLQAAAGDPKLRIDAIRTGMTVGLGAKPEPSRLRHEKAVAGVADSALGPFRGSPAHDDLGRAWEQVTIADELLWFGVTTKDGTPRTCRDSFLREWHVEHAPLQLGI
ncbi:hypothetical protein [Actinomadura rudentiformis]|uniref:Uncharacterized protein n=1 Tax=Actinomadura rudentiformis TaxID=359158 RepID=A0A6H9YG71_9ACTN|nr:hypothetical protein [Actinomadura rudentiformis]KAB2343754.1 hypothetical protein F8566_34135 [Actinomadura rudentiformis]